jgi:ATP-dependent Clp protease protease subunit
MLFIKKRMAELIAEHSGHTVEEIEADSDRDRWFDAEAAREYGIIDHVYSTAADSPEVKAAKGKGDAK